MSPLSTGDLVALWLVGAFAVAGWLSAAITWGKLGRARQYLSDAAHSAQDQGETLRTLRARNVELDRQLEECRGLVDAGNRARGLLHEQLNETRDERDRAFRLSVGLQEQVERLAKERDEALEAHGLAEKATAEAITERIALAQTLDEQNVAVNRLTAELTQERDAHRITTGRAHGIAAEKATLEGEHRKTKALAVDLERRVVEHVEKLGHARIALEEARTSTEEGGQVTETENWRFVAIPKKSKVKPVS